jgi:hypothetical protein
MIFPTDDEGIEKRVTSRGGTRGGGVRFVWLTTNGRVFAEKWPQDAPEGCTWGGIYSAKRINIVAEHLIPEAEHGFTIAELQTRYPAPSHVGEILSPLGFWA